jgi:5-methylcytosine-specific restriction enzyme subunit McrC
VTPPATLHLRERRARLCKLAPDEVRHLLEHHRTHLDLAPTATPHAWRVTPAGVAGVILTPRRRILISPKIPLRNLLFLGDDEPEPDWVNPSDGILDPLAERLARLMCERAAAGLHRDYREAREQGPYLLGRLDLAAQLRQPAGRKDQLHSRHDAFTADLPCNQVPRVVARALAESPLLGAGARARLAQALAGFSHVAEAALTPDVLAELRSPRLPAAYRPLAELCLLLAAARAPALLVSLERWFEQYLTKTVEEAFLERPHQVSVQQIRHVGAPGVTLRPDVTIDRDGAPSVVVDAKWKRLAASGPESDDLYQVLAYATLLGAGRAVLVYPGRRGGGEWTFEHTPVRVQARTLDVSGPAERCRASRLRLGRELMTLHV